MRPVSRGALLVGCLLLGSACAGDPALVQSIQSARQENGVSLNGVSLNGVSLNGVSLNGVSLNGVSLNGVSLNGVSLNGVSLNGSELMAVDAGGSELSGAQLAGAEFEGVLSDGSTLRLKIGATWVNADPDIRWYSVFYWADTKQGQDWLTLCNAVPLTGRWNLEQGVSGGGDWIDDPSVFTFACDGGALTKCLNLGYKPWRYAVKEFVTQEGMLAIEVLPLRDHHQACTRLIRADYCGDGTPWTVDGRVVNVYDEIGIQYDTEKFKFEAEWSPRGARCVHSTRADEMWAGGQQPSCFPLVVDHRCGNDWDDPETLLMNEYLDTNAGNRGGGKK